MKPEASPQVIGTALVSLFVAAWMVAAPARAAPPAAGGTAASRAPVPASAYSDTAPARAPGVPAGGPQFFLSWNGPWGSPGASQVRKPACADTTRADTLYLCLRPGVNLPSFIGFTAELRFHAELPETLGTYWHFERGGENQSGASIRFQPESHEQSWTTPWRSGGNGGVGYLRAPATGQLRLIYAVAPADSVALEGDRVYTLACIALQARRGGLSGCHQGVALELSRATLATDTMHEYTVTTGGARHAGYGARGIPALARLWRLDEHSARWRLGRVEDGGAWPPAN